MAGIQIPLDDLLLEHRKLSKISHGQYSKYVVPPLGESKFYHQLSLSSDGESLCFPLSPNRCSGKTGAVEIYKFTLTSGVSGDDPLDR